MNDYTQQRLREIAEESGDFSPVLRWHKVQRERERRALLRGPARVYVIPAREFVKIGIATDIEERWRTIRTGNPLVERPFYVSEPQRGARELEKRAHAALAAYRVESTEWFRCSKSLAAETIRQVIEEFSTGA